MFNAQYVDVATENSDVAAKHESMQIQYQTTQITNIVSMQPALGGVEQDFHFEVEEDHVANNYRIKRKQKKYMVETRRKEIEMLL